MAEATWLLPRRQTTSTVQILKLPPIEWLALLAVLVFVPFFFGEMGLRGRSYIIGKVGKKAMIQDLQCMLRWHTKVQGLLERKRLLRECL